MGNRGEAVPQAQRRRVPRHAGRSRPRHAPRSLLPKRSVGPRPRKTLLPKLLCTPQTPARALIPASRARCQEGEIASPSFMRTYSMERRQRERLSRVEDTHFPRLHTVPGVRFRRHRERLSGSEVLSAESLCARRAQRRKSVILSRPHNSQLLSEANLPKQAEQLRREAT